jgi:hypothetical protein
MKSFTSLKLAPFITLLAVGCAGIVSAQSQGPSPRLAQLADAEGCEFPEAPSVPEADTVTMEQMVAAQGAIQAYIEESNELLECLDGIAGDDDLTDDDQQIAIEGYNIEVAAQESLAERWNVQRTRFLEMQ